VEARTQEQLQEERAKYQEQLQEEKTKDISALQ